MIIWEKVDEKYFDERNKVGDVKSYVIIFLCGKKKKIENTKTEIKTKSIQTQKKINTVNETTIRRN